MSKELTEAWKAGKLKCGYFFLKLINEHVTIGFYDSISFSCCCDFGIKEVISPCDYEIWAHLETKAEWQAERIKELEQDVKTLTNNYKLLEKQQAENLAHGQALVDEFGDFEALYEELKNLRFLLKECDGCVRSLRARGVSDCNGSNLNDLLTRITTAIGESEEK